LETRVRNRMVFMQDCVEDFPKAPLIEEHASKNFNPAGMRTVGSCEGESISSIFTAGMYGLGLLPAASC
ncbi:hypothetical protein NDU88_003556, partial [Pleurodeles waltl]